MNASASMTAPAPATTEFAKGLAGIVAGQTAICSLSGTLRYRGYDIEPLARAGDFEEVAWLLLHGERPNWPAFASGWRRRPGRSPGPCSKRSSGWRPRRPRPHRWTPSAPA